MAPLLYAAKSYPFLSLDCARVEGGGRKERKGSTFAIWQPCPPLLFKTGLDCVNESRERREAIATLLSKESR